MALDLDIQVDFDLLVVLGRGLVSPVIESFFDVEATLLAIGMKLRVEIWSHLTEEKFTSRVVFHDDLRCMHLGWRITTSSPTSLGSIDLEESSSCVLRRLLRWQVDLILSFEHLLGDAREDQADG